MPSYYKNRNGQWNGDHEVHKEGCSYMPAKANQHYLGEYSSCHGAVAKARETDHSADGCAHCSPTCHSS
ncbi:MAG: hypothetical protein KKB66_16875 [Alphaproteobacteria bacterium]|nr:hypothetical protein [Alphaproteobacteria bacterium]MBU0804150.1 hypothetical protein [Alphaproteobacteria bacterium]MBU0870981.1 hypothetical protein [Alphaproteobacteria bacterium]MBU1400736.1 hypothetical protein [Alphaproteobacteria bacterium]MBU1592847.1 hypothetical protein [Alphaproteobacteria bacterium]